MNLKYTRDYKKIEETLPCTIVLGFDNRRISSKAVWDTGATNTCIGINHAHALGCKLRGIRKGVELADGEKKDCYMAEIDISLGGKNVFKDIPVTVFPEPQKEVLLGMDIITKGSFVLTNKVTSKLRFDVPSVDFID